MKINILTNQG